MTKKKKEPETQIEKEIEKPEWEDENSQNGNGSILYRVLIRLDNQFNAPFPHQGKVITRQWQDAGNLLLEEGGLERFPTDYRTLKKHGHLPFIIRDDGPFGYDGAMAFAFWCKANIEGKYSDSLMSARIEVSLQRIRVTHSLKLERELALHGLPMSLDTKSFIEEIEGIKEQS